MIWEPPAAHDMAPVSHHDAMGLVARWERVVSDAMEG